MGKILLDYVFPISVVEPTPAASTAYLKQVVVVAKPKAGQEANVGELYLCTTMQQVAARTDDVNAQQLFNAGMTKVYVLLADDLNIAEYVPKFLGLAWTVLISDDFVEADVLPSSASLVKAQLTFTSKLAGPEGNDITIAFIAGGTAGAEIVTVVGKAISVSMATGVSTATQLKTALDASAPALALITTTIAGGGGATAQAAFAVDNLEGGDGLYIGTFDGVVAFSSEDSEAAADFAVPPNRVGFFHSPANGSKNMFYAFGKLLSNLSSWSNKQYITMPFNDGIDDLGEANTLFDSKVSFVLTDDEFGNRLALFAAGGKAIAAPYIGKNLRIDLQSRALNWIANNEPDYTIVMGALLEDELNTKVIEEKYITPKLIRDGYVVISLIQDNFVANGEINIAEPKALWRVIGEMQSTL